MFAKQNDSNVLTVKYANNIANLRRGCRYSLPKFYCTFKICHSSSVDDIINTIAVAKENIESYFKDLYDNKTLKIFWLEFLNDSVQVDQNVCHIELNLTRKMHQIVRDGSFMQKVCYIQLVGAREDIIRQEHFLDVAVFCKFQKILHQLSITNYFGDTCSSSSRIHAVHFQYAEHDEEIREGLRVTKFKHSQEFPVFVQSEEALEYSLEMCQVGSTLVLDGHWVH